MKTYKKILIGGLGALTPIIMNLLVIDLEVLLLNVTLFAVLGYTIRVIILFYLGGITAFLHKDEHVKNFLNMWYLQTLKYTTQDQVGFPYVCQKTNMIPFTLPNNEISGSRPHIKTMFYKKHDHSK